MRSQIKAFATKREPVVFIEEAFAGAPSLSLRASVRRCQATLILTPLDLN
jgi:hypothetical protein